MLITGCPLELCGAGIQTAGWLAGLGGSQEVKFAKLDLRDVCASLLCGHRPRSCVVKVPGGHPAGIVSALLCAFCLAWVAESPCLRVAAARVPITAILCGVRVTPLASVLPGSGMDLVGDVSSPRRRSGSALPPTFPAWFLSGHA